jgi:hypothetical protein
MNETQSPPKSEPEKPASIQSSRSWRIPSIPTKSLSVLVVGGVFVAALLKADPKDIPELVRIMFSSDLFCGVGWVLAVAFLAFGVILVVILGNLHSREISRIASERDRLQDLLLTRPNEKHPPRTETGR